MKYALQDSLEQNIARDCVDFQKDADLHLSANIETKRKELDQISEDLASLERTLNELSLQLHRQQGKKSIDLSSIQEVIRSFEGTWDRLQNKLPPEKRLNYQFHDVTKPIPDHLLYEFKGHLESLKTQRQNEMPRLTNEIEVALNLHKLLSEITKEAIKEQNAQVRNILSHVR